MPGVNVGIDDMRADEPGPSGNEYSHRASVLALLLCSQLFAKVGDGLPEPVFERHLRLPPQQTAGEPNVRLPDFGIINRQWFKCDLTAAAGQRNDEASKLQDR